MGSGTCTASKPASATITGSGPHKVVAELNSGAGIVDGTIIRPAELGTEEKYPIFAFGENGCIQNSLEAQNFLGEVASHGYFVIADGLHMSDWGYACFAQLLGDDIIKSVGQIKLGVNVPSDVRAYRPM